MKSIFIDQKGCLDVKCNINNNEIIIEHRTCYITTVELGKIFNNNNFTIEKTIRKDISNSSTKEISIDINKNKNKDKNNYKKKKWNLPPWNICIALLLWLVSICYFFRDKVKIFEYFKVKHSFI